MNECSFHSFSSSLLILRMAVTATGTAFLVSLICAVLYFMPWMLDFDLTGYLSWDENKYFFSINQKFDTFEIFEFPVGFKS